MTFSFKGLFAFLIPLIFGYFLGYLILILLRYILIGYYNYDKKEVFKETAIVFWESIFISIIIWAIKFFIYEQLNLFQWTVPSIVVIEVLRQILTKRN
ncbi:preprotein translocase subunit SecE [Thermoanaerobacter sp. A7A]|uniref:preprotein translocase subunit SecE n=1 Tax=Thermoanaerobacter sp. A7A TaxID=1350366 RepID=UPI00040BCD3E|nr:preprotein translocase subunit SecE [Thermoanaerobacter sp. A7A]